MCVWNNKKKHTDEAINRSTNLDDINRVNECNGNDGGCTSHADLKRFAGRKKKERMSNDLLEYMAAMLKGLSRCFRLTWVARVGGATLLFDSLILLGGLLGPKVPMMAGFGSESVLIADLVHPRQNPEPDVRTCDWLNAPR